MEDRYEIREQLGKGGNGAVYRAYDRHLNREVAIKRILPDGGVEDRAEAMRQMTEEAATLCSLQHPHIVTVYDVGSDEDSPFVVMELLTGRTLEELTEAGPLTWEDFRELALQSQEALIAAQERQLLHRDIKPGNVMLTWLPSGKFQVKLVDFGLAKFAPQPTQQEINEDDSIFGSIHFMAPEQFERKPLDPRTDMYAMGCVYYHALTSIYPFRGNTGQEVMEAHLQHQVKPLHELRPDLPRWAADWVMWHMNRNPDDRPTDAREALEKFIIMTEQPTSTTPQPASPTPEPPRRPRLIIPGVTPPAEAAAPAQPVVPVAAPAPEPVVLQPAPAPVLQPAPAPVPVAPAQVVPPAAVHPASQPTAAVVQPRPEPRPTSPQPLQPPAGSKPSVHTAARKSTTSVVTQQATVEQQTVQLTPAGQPGAGVVIGGPVLATARAVQPVPGQVLPGQALPVVAKKKRKGMSNAVKVSIAAGLGLLVVLIAWLMLNRVAENKRNQIYNSLVVMAKDPSIKEIPLNKEQLAILLGAASSLVANAERETVYQCLYLGKSTDGTDIDREIADHATAGTLADTVRVKLFKVLELRGNRAVMPQLLAFARKSAKLNEVSAALEACKAMAGDDDLPEFLAVLETTNETPTRRAAEATIAEIIERSNNREPLGATLAAAYEKQVNKDAREALLRLVGYAGGERAGELVKSALEGDDKLLRQSAILAIGNWPDDSMFPVLMEYLEGEEDLQFRQRAFDTAYKFLTFKKRQRTPEESEDLWKSLAQNAKTDREQTAIINGLARIPDGDWMIPVIEYFIDEAEADRVIDQAEKALDHIRERERIKGGKEEEGDQEEKEVKEEKEAKEEKGEETGDGEGEE